MSNSNNRAMLLSGLRTGGVRPTPGQTMPQTAAINGSFQAPRFSTPHQQQPLFEENIDDMNSYANLSYGMPMTAALDGRAPRFQQQQQLQFLQHQARLAAINGNNGMNGMANPMDPIQAQFLQMQLMQAMVAQQQQAQKLQAELAMQQQVAAALSNQRQAPNRVVSTGSRMPSTAGPMQTSFDVPQMSRMRSEQMPSFDERNEIGAAPMTAALGGKFGSRSLPTGLNPNAPTFRMGSEGEAPVPIPATPSGTVVISGGVSLGAPSTPNPANTLGPSKSDAAVSWRRGSNAASTVFNRSGSPPKTLGRQSPPTAASPEPVTRDSPTPNGQPKYRPQPLRIRENQAMLPSVTIENEQGMSIYSSAKMPSPTGSNSSGESLRKYEAQGKAPVGSYNAPSVRHSQPVRQPRGPPSGVEEVSSLNFASRTKRLATNPMVMRHEPGFVEAY